MATNASKSTIVKLAFGARSVETEDQNILADIEKIYSRSKALEVSQKANQESSNRRVHDYATNILTKIKAAAEAGNTVAYYELTKEDKDSGDRRNSLRQVMWILNNTTEQIDADKTYIENPEYKADKTKPKKIEYKVNGEVIPDSKIFGYSIKAQKKIDGKYPSTSVADSIIATDKWNTKDVDRFVISWESSNT